MNFKKRIGTRIKKLRKSKNITQEKLAKKIGIDNTYISRIEKGKIGEGMGPSERVIEYLVRELENPGNSKEIHKLYEDLMLATNRIPYLPKLKEIVFNEPKVCFDFIHGHSRMTKIAANSAETPALGLIKESPPEKKIKSSNP